MVEDYCRKRVEKLFCNERCWKHANVYAVVMVERQLLDSKAFLGPELFESRFRAALAAPKKQEVSRFPGNEGIVCRVF